jgi:hypothetical protein
MKMEHTCNPITPEAEAGGSIVPGQLGLHSETLSQKTNKLKKKNMIHVQRPLLYTVHHCHINEKS